MHKNMRALIKDKARLLLLLALLLVASMGMFGEALAQDTPPGTSIKNPTQADVRVDGLVLFQVRGISAFPAEDRARVVAERIKEFASEGTLPADAITFRADGDQYQITAGDRVLVTLVQADADMERIPLPLLAKVAAAKTAESVRQFREDRTPAALRRSALLTGGLTVLLVLLIWGLSKLRKWLERSVRHRVDTGMADLERKSGAAVHRGHLWGLAQGLLQILWLLSLLVIGYFYLSSVLGTFPWTRSVAQLLLYYIKSPLVSMGNATLDSIPNLIFLVVLWFVVRYLLQALRTFFRAVETKRVQLASFEPEWSQPTYRLLRLAVVAMAVVVAYPYIPGSDSAAFKGVSLFLGVIVSLGSTSFIANLIAGTALTYRGVFREGDWVVIGDEEGRVEEIRAQMVRLRTRGNERISIPSSTILNSNVTNLSDQMDKRGLVLRCSISIGYDISWRKVESLLLAAAEQTDGLLAEPPPLVQTNELGDFAVEYALLVRVAEPANMPSIQTLLNRAILDQFHQAGIQIMSPAYENDPATIKIPPDERGPD